MKSEALNGLNDDQKKPVLDYMGPCFIVAGPGSGKTSTIVARADYMIKSKEIDPKKILMFTFTNKAAKEIKERITQKVGSKGEHLTVGTYHNICSRILRKHASVLGFTKKFTIFDTDDSLCVLKEIITGHFINITPRDTLSVISDWKNKMISPEFAMQNYTKEYAAIYKTYQDELKRQNAMDFDDLVYLTIRLLEQNNDILRSINKQYQYIIADEFHDSSKRDIRLIELLGGSKQNVCMILDDEQSIYSFRGADLASVLSVGKIFPQLKTFILRRNYRSTKSILNAARTLIKNNANQLPKELYTENPQGVPVMLFNEKTIYDEALRVVKLIQFLKSRYDIRNKEIAVLYRVSFLSRAIEEKLVRYNIPYKLIGGSPFYARKEIKDLLCFLRLAYNNNDCEAFKRIINIPKRGLGDVTVDKILEHAIANGENILDACQSITLKGKAAEGIKEFNSFMDKLTEHMHSASVSATLNFIIDQTAYYRIIDDTSKNKDISNIEDRTENIRELIQIASEFEDIDDFMQNSMLTANSEDTCSDDKVNLQTIHSSKGLEYKAVIIIGANENIIPHKRATTDDQVDEERRLFYVAMTRAMEYLFITRSEIMMNMGRTEISEPSRFINEIDKRYMQIN